MKTMELIEKKIRELKPILKEKYNVKKISIFGSYVRGEQEMASDIDILVEFNNPIGFFQFMRLEFDLEENLGLNVDLVSKNALKPRIGEHILREAIEI